MKRKNIKATIFLLFSCLILLLSFSWSIYQVAPLDIIRYFAANAGSTIGITVGVPENPFNILAQQLKEKELELEEREKMIEEKEAGLGQGISSIKDNILLVLILAITAALFLLIILNFYFDYKERKKEDFSQQ